MPRDDRRAGPLLPAPRLRTRVWPNRAHRRTRPAREQDCSHRSNHRGIRATKSAIRPNHEALHPILRKSRENLTARIKSSDAFSRSQGHSRPRRYSHMAVRFRSAPKVDINSWNWPLTRCANSDPRNQFTQSPRRKRKQLAHTASFAAFTGRALTIFRAGLALNTVGSFVNGLMPARSFVAGFLMTTNFAKPGNKNAPFFFNSL